MEKIMNTAKADAIMKGSEAIMAKIAEKIAAKEHLKRVSGGDRDWWIGDKWCPECGALLVFGRDVDGFGYWDCWCECPECWFHERWAE